MFLKSGFLVGEWKHPYGAWISWKKWRVKALETSPDSNFVGGREECKISREMWRCYNSWLNTVLLGLFVR